LPYNSTFHKKCVAAKTYFTDKDGNNISLSSLLSYPGPIPQNLKTREGFGQWYRLPSGDQVLMKEYYRVWFVCFYPVESTSCRPQDFFKVLDNSESKRQTLATALCNSSDDQEVPPPPDELDPPLDEDPNNPEGHDQEDPPPPEPPPPAELDPPLDEDPDPEVRAFPDDDPLKLYPEYYKERERDPEKQREFMYHLTNMGSFPELHKLAFGLINNKEDIDAAIQTTKSQLEDIAKEIKLMSPEVIKNFTSKSDPLAPLPTCAACGIREYGELSEKSLTSLNILIIDSTNDSDAETLRIIMQARNTYIRYSTSKIRTIKY